MRAGGDGRRGTCGPNDQPAACVSAGTMAGTVGSGAARSRCASSKPCATAALQPAPHVRHAAFAGEAARQTTTRHHLRVGMVTLSGEAECIALPGDASARRGRPLGRYPEPVGGFVPVTRDTGTGEKQHAKGGRGPMVAGFGAHTESDRCLRVVRRQFAALGRAVADRCRRLRVARQCCTHTRAERGHDATRVEVV